MSNTIGDVKAVTGKSLALNCQKGQGTQKPMASGSGNPGDSKPPKPADGSVPMPK